MFGLVQYDYSVHADYFGLVECNEGMRVNVAVSGTAYFVCYDLWSQTNFVDVKYHECNTATPPLQRTNHGLASRCIGASLHSDIYDAPSLTIIASSISFRMHSFVATLPYLLLVRVLVLFHRF